LIVIIAIFKIGGQSPAMPIIEATNLDENMPLTEGELAGPDNVDYHN
jgi:hypothetical protein